MAKFASASKQAASVMKEIQGRVIQSVGTVRDYESSLRVAAEWAKENKIQGGLRGMTVADANRFLEERSKIVNFKTVDQNRQALQAMMHHVTHQLDEKERLDASIRGLNQNLTSRTYTDEQVKVIASYQTEKNALATLIAHDAGLRASELNTLRPLEERAPSDRPALPEKFMGRDDVSFYTVHGKGGLVRVVAISNDLAKQLESYRLSEPKIIRDRGVNVEKHYDIGGGNAWSASFTRASQNAFGWSHGGHGLRHSYAQERMQTLKESGLSDHHAKETVSQEVGHFRPDITDTYLR